MTIISLPNETDVLCGRGRKVYDHKGNQIFRRLIKKNKQLYIESRKLDKFYVSKHIVESIRLQNPPGRFLEWESGVKEWREISEVRAIEKTSQALRERRASYEESAATLCIAKETKNFDFGLLNKQIPIAPFSDSYLNIENSVSSNSLSMHEIASGYKHDPMTACLMFEKSLHESCKEIGVDEEELDKLIYKIFQSDRTSDSYSSYQSSVDHTSSDSSSIYSCPNGNGILQNKIVTQDFNRNSLMVKKSNAFSVDTLLQKYKSV